MGVGEEGCVSAAGMKECWLRPHEFGQGMPDHRSEPVFLFQLFMGTWALSPDLVSAP